MDTANTSIIKEETLESQWIPDEEVMVLNEWVEELIAADNVNSTSNTGSACDDSNKTRIVCNYCQSSFTVHKSYYRHCRNVHKMKPILKRKARIKCPMCDNRFHTYDQLRAHVISSHGITILEVRFTFNSMQDFEDWKITLEKKECSRFVKRRAPVLSRTFYFCHRDGELQSKNSQKERLRRFKYQGSCRIGAACPASISVYEKDNQVEVTYYPTHLGHEPDKERNFIPLTEEEKIEVAKAGLMSSWKRRNNAKFQGEPKIKKVRQLVKKLSNPAEATTCDTEDNNGDAALPENNDTEELKMPLFDFTSPKRLFQSLIQPTEFGVFFNAFWEQKPLILHRHKSLNHEQLSELIELFSKKTLLQLAKQNEMHFTKDLNALRYKDDKREDLNDVGRITAAKLNKLFDKDKATVQVHQPQRFQNGLWQIMEYLESFFGTLVGANVYITPGGSQGLSPHHDDVEVFILQLEGQKHWRLYKPIEELPRSYSTDLSLQEMGEPTHDFILQPGDLLYFPRGTIHQADTPEGVSHSTHITFSTYQHHCWGDYMMSVFPHILEEAMKSDVSFRRGLPINFIKSTKLSQTDKVQSVMGLLLQKLVTIKPPNFVAPENMIADFMRCRLPPHLVQGQDLRANLPNGKPPDLSSKVRLRHPDHVCFLVRRNEAPDEEEGSEEEEEEDESDNDNDAGSSGLNQSGASSARFLSRSLMTPPDVEALYVYSSIFNDHSTHMMYATPQDDNNGFALRFPKYYSDCLNQLKSSCDQFTPVSKLTLPGDADKENLIRALWSSHLLEVIPGTGTKSKAGRKSTKLD